MSAPHNPNEITRTAVEQRVVDDHGDWMRSNAFALRILEITKTLGVKLFANGVMRQQIFDEMGLQIAQDAFMRGMGILALSAPQYAVHRYAGAWVDPEAQTFLDRMQWLPALPPLDMLESSARIEIKIEAYVFPIAKREV